MRWWCRGSCGLEVGVNSGAARFDRDVAEAQMVIWKNSEYMQHKESGTKAKELERQEVEVDQ